MNKEIDFETNLIISYGKFEIFLLDLKNYKNIYHEEFKFREDTENLDFNLLSEFLENNIFKIEKLAGNFVNNINVVIENKSILISNIAIKKKNYSGEVTNVILESMLTDIKDLFIESYNQHKLIHMVINKYKIDGVSYHSLQNEIINDEICLEVKLISIPNLILIQIERILKNFQIQVINYLEKNYVKNFFQDEELDISIKVNNLLNGLNKNEVKITTKSKKKQGFFEKFFQLFS
ncbi:hypothetical protein [Candidatus Pelagibacter sp. HIMB1493]|uniref:hypothetical protein n=1 Tax=Candidatus Pelagibacter sp. HIMB1493 TaxID=3413334 RepID=UPI003F8587BB